MPKTDSIISAEERSAKIKAESARLEKEEAEKEAKQKAYQNQQDDIGARARNADVDRAIASLSELETRDQLLTQIRTMREPLPETEYKPQLTERMQQELNAEQQAGRAAVERSMQALEHNRANAARIAAEERQRLGEMQPVHHPNPSMNEQFAASGATLGKRK